MNEEELATYVKCTWPMFEAKVRVPLRDLFPEPKTTGLRQIWMHGHADVAVFRGGKLVAVLEPGGAHHFEEKQSLNDRRKYALCRLNGVNCLFFAASLPEKLSRRKFRNMIRKALFSKV